jgi:hypothetical protein
VAKYQFLSDEWFAAVDGLVAEHGAEAPGAADVLLNLTVTDTPFGSERRLHLGVRGGHADWGIGHADDADLQISTDYATAKDVFVSGDPAAGMQAFMSGKVRVQGDMAKLMAAQTSGGGPGGASPLQAAVHEITE